MVENTCNEIILQEMSNTLTLRDTFRRDNKENFLYVKKSVKPNILKIF